MKKDIFINQAGCSMRTGHFARCGLISPLLGERKPGPDLSLRRLWQLFLLGLLLLASPDSASAKSARQLVAQGNEAYKFGQYQDALDRYEQAAPAAPESPVIDFNKGAAFYKSGEYAKAAEAFAQAALKSKDAQLASRSKFNLGNCSFREAELLRPKDVSQALAACEKSIQAYQEALALDSKFKPAAENIEIARLTMKALLEEKQKKEQEQQQQQKAQQDAVEKLKELIEQQQQAADQNQSLADQKKKQGESQSWKDGTQKLAQQQEELQQETQQTAQQMDKMQTSPQDPQSPAPSQDSSPQAAKEHLEKAAAEQKAASEKLEQRQNESARENQSKALEELKKALQSLAQNQPSPQQPQENKPSSEKPSGQPQPQDQLPAPQNSDQAPPEGNTNDFQMPLTDQAQDILKEERANQMDRKRRTRAGTQPVAKDW